MTRTSSPRTLHLVLLVALGTGGCHDQKAPYESGPRTEAKADADPKPDGAPEPAPGKAQAIAKAPEGKAPEGKGGITEAVTEVRAARVEKQVADAEALLRNGRLEKAGSLAEEILEAHPEHPGATRLLGRVRLEQERWAEAETLLAKGAEAKSTDARAWAELGRARTELDDPEGAVTAYAKANALDEEDPEIAYAYGRAVLKTGDAARAEALFNAAAEADPKLQYVYTSIGDAQLQQRKYEDALKSYMKAQTTYASDKMARAGAARVYEALGDNRRAIDQWSSYIRMDCCSDYSNDVAKPKLLSLSE